MQELPNVRGAFSLVFMDATTLYAARDPYGIRPLVIGKLENGWVVASETAALDIVGASFVRDIEPGELIAIDEAGMRSQTFAAPTPKHCLFEYVYLARPDTVLTGHAVHAVRVEVGRTLAKEHPIDADIVIPVPESGTPAAVGYAQGAGIPFAQGFVKNAYVGRTFIHSTISNFASARHPIEAQSTSRRNHRQTHHRGRRFNCARKHSTRNRKNVA